MRAGNIPSILATLGLLLGLSVPSPAATAEMVSGDRFSTGQGDLVIHPISHATFVMAWNDTVIYVDPVGGGDTFADLPDPDLIVITDIHGDHLNVDTLNAVTTNDTRLVAPSAAAEKLPSGLRSRTTVMANGDTGAVMEIGFEAVPMYNTTEERLKFHPKGRGNGYVLTLADTRVYIAGDTEDIPEMRDLENIDIAFVPMNLPYTMTPKQAASAVNEFQPDVVYPYHYRGSDVDAFRQMVESETDVDVRLGDWYEN